MVEIGNLSSQIEILEEKVSTLTIAEFSESQEAKKHSMRPLNTKEAPSVGKEESQEMPGVRKDIKLVYSEAKGRQLVATEDIQPGEIVIVETPYSSILLPEYYNTHCQTCYHRVIAPIPCWCCAKVRKSFHKSGQSNSMYLKIPNPLFPGPFLL